MKILARILRAWADWCHPTPERSADVLAFTRILAATAEQFADGTSGEYKRAWVYGKLLKKFPAHPKSTLGLTVELVVQELQ
jgi:hypothetical protein